MQRIVFKRAIPFGTTAGTVVTDTVITDGDPYPDGSLNVVAVLDYAKTIVPHATKCIFSKNTILRAEPYTEKIPS